jgi:hypothetical protein
MRRQPPALPQSPGEEIEPTRQGRVRRRRGRKTANPIAARTAPITESPWAPKVLAPRAPRGSRRAGGAEGSRSRGKARRNGCHAPRKPCRTGGFGSRCWPLGLLGKWPSYSGVPKLRAPFHLEFGDSPSCEERGEISSFLVRVRPPRNSLPWLIRRHTARPCGTGFLERSVVAFPETTNSMFAHQRAREPT